MFPTTAQEAYKKAEDAHRKAKERYLDAKTDYELEWAKAADMTKTRALSEGVKLTVSDIKYKLLILQSNRDHLLGRAFIKLAVKHAKMGKKKIAMKNAERAYWNEIR